MKALTRIIFSLGIIIFCLFLFLSVIETVETTAKTDLDQKKVNAHIQKLTENGPRSIIDKDANSKAIEYIASELEKYGAQKGDLTDSFAYLIQDYVAEDTKGLYQNFYLQNVIAYIPASSEAPTGRAALFMAHVDSVPTSFGAADDGIACAVMLEAIRYYSEQIENGAKTNNDLIFCFVNGEEYDLLGSRAFMNEFKGFNNVTSRIDFAVNFESRGTNGTLVMFETAENNENTVKLFADINKTVYACSITDLIYSTMPNSTDFSNLKKSYQGINIANVGGNENYHTQNDNADTVTKEHISQQSQITEDLIEKLSVSDISGLNRAERSAIYFSYLDLATVVYGNGTALILALIGIALMSANILLSKFYRKQKNIKKTAKSIALIIGGSFVSAGIAAASYFLFQLSAAVFGKIDLHTLGSVNYSSVSISVALILISLASSAFAVIFECSPDGIDRRDVTRALAYIHTTLGIILTFALPAASYLFMISGIMLMINELVITLVKKHDMSKLHLELIATAFYLPIILPISLLTVSAIGFSAAHVYCFIFSLILFGVGNAIAPLLKYASPRPLIGAIRKKKLKLSSYDGAIAILSVAVIMILASSLTTHNVSVNLQSSQTIHSYSYDDALIYVKSGSGESEYRIYDLNAYPYLKKYSSDMEYVTKNGKSYYRCDASPLDTDISVLSKADGNTIAVKKSSEGSVIYLTITSRNAGSFTLTDGITSRTYGLESDVPHNIMIHSDCVLTFNGGSADIEYTEVIRNHPSLLSEQYDGDLLNFNLWLTERFRIE